MGFLKKLLKERKNGTAAVTRASPVDSASRSQKSATVERIQNEAGSPKSPSLVTSEVVDPSTFAKSTSIFNSPQLNTVHDELASDPDRKFSTAHIEQQKENLHSRVDSYLTGSSSAEPRLAKSLQRLNESVTEFEEIYAKHADKEVEKKGDNALSKVLNDVQLTDDMFDNAAALENRINQTLTRREELKEDRSRRKSMSRYIVNVFPLLKFLVDIGGMAAQVIHPISVINSRLLVVFQLLRYCVRPLSSWG
jgi:3-phenylpropionate/cinnamic acid dioxygenase small subunit